MAKKEQTTNSVARLSNEHFRTLTARELLDYKEFADILYSFYDNEMKVYANEFGVNSSMEYIDARQEAAKYLKIRELIFNEIKNRIDTIYEKTLA